MPVGNEGWGALKVADLKHEFKTGAVSPMPVGNEGWGALVFIPFRVVDSSGRQCLSAMRGGVPRKLESEKMVELTGSPMPVGNEGWGALELVKSELERQQ